MQRSQYRSSTWSYKTPQFSIIKLTFIPSLGADISPASVPRLTAESVEALEVEVEVVEALFVTGVTG